MASQADKSRRAGGGASPPRGGSDGRTKAGLEAELGTVRQELAAVDGYAARMARHVDYARFLLMLAGVVCLVYAFALTTRRA